ncbi:mediator-associated protein 1-like, partial [Trifolium medium]|nr:mediator-associated protein 1-like [Trifolium medium]
TGGGSDDENETEEDVKLTGEDSKKSHQRIFREEDELTILKGLADFISKTKKDPLKDASAFHSFVKKSLRAEANSEQLKRKVRTLKKKFETSDSFTKPHDKKAFELFKK